MEDFVLAGGVLLAIIGPLLLVPITWLLHRYVLRPIVKRARVSLVLSLAIVAIAVTMSYVPGKLEFDRLCMAHATPSITQRVHVDGFFHDHLHPYEARALLQDGPFRYVEVSDMYEEGKYLRYTRAGDGTITEEIIPQITSVYAVSDTTSELSYGITLQEKRVSVRANGRQLARAAQVVYQGGPLALLLGVYAMSSCPDITTPRGSKNFDTFYSLERRVLGGG